MPIRTNFEADLTTRRGMEVLSLRYGEEAAKIFALENRIRDRLDENGKPITDSEANQYRLLLKKYRRNTNILSRLIAQAPYHKS